MAEGYNKITVAVQTKKYIWMWREIGAFPKKEDIWEYSSA